MKKAVVLLQVLLVCLMVVAQAPDKMSYQAVIRTANGALVTNQTIGMRISLVQGSVSGTVVYVETQAPMTNENGLVTLEIGAGTTTDQFSTIDWSKGPYFVKVETDPTGGTNYSIVGTSQLLSVPYAFAAKTAESISATAQPTVSLPPLSDVRTNTATLAGLVNGKGFSTTVTFEWGSTPSYGNQSTPDPNPVTGNQDVLVSTTLTNLQPSTTYHYRLKAVNAVNVSYSNDKTFTTQKSAAQVSTISLTAVKAFSASAGGYISSDGGSAITDRGICYSTNASPTVSDNHVSNGGGVGSFSVNLTGLLSATKYYVRAYATNAIGTTYGNELTFTTKDGVVPLTTTTVSNITGSTATSGGFIQDDGGDPITACGICWDTLPAPTVALPTKTVQTVSSGSFTSALSGLEVGRTYYVRAYATNGLGTSYGNMLTFTVAAIGTRYDNGIVFYVDSTGKHGLVCAEYDQVGVGNGIAWSNGTQVVTGATGTAIGTGKANTLAIVNTLGAGTYAAKFCYDMEPAGTWFLPSKDELQLMYTVVKLNNYSIFHGYYWSSTELNASQAWEMTFANGTGLFTDKNDATRLLRAVKEF